jgi:hypothetical protein
MLGAFDKIFTKRPHFHGREISRGHFWKQPFRLTEAEEVEIHR